MSPTPPPQGMSDVDYEAIEAAVTETVRGRWFLNEFARRNRAAEAELMLEGLARLETLITTNQAASNQAASLALPPPPSADPSVRLMIQRIKEIAGQLDTLTHDMREDGVEDRYCDALEAQARAVAGLMRAGTMAPPEPRAAKPRMEQPRPDQPRLEQPRPDQPRLEQPPADPLGAPPAADPRLQALAGLDALSLAQKLALFT